MKIENFVSIKLFESLRSSNQSAIFSYISLKVESSSLEKKEAADCIVALQSSMELDAVDAENSEWEPAVHVQVSQLLIDTPVNQGSKIDNNLVKFRKVILEAPSNKCFSCKKLHYGRLGRMIACDEASKMLEVVFGL